MEVAWARWRDLSGVIYDKKIPIKLKVKLYTTIVRPALLYGSETWVVRRKEEQMLEKTEMRMLRRIKGVTIRDKVRSHDIRKELGVSDIKEKVREARLRWYGHVMRSYKESMVRRVMEWQVTVSPSQTKLEVTISGKS